MGEKRIWPVPHQISPPNSNFIKPGASFPGFLLTLPNHTLVEAPPSDTEPLHLARASQPKNLPFPPCSRRVSPIQAASFHLQTDDGECLPATQLYLSVFTCPTGSLDLLSDAGESLPARQPYLFHPTAGETYPSRPQVFSSPRMSARASRPPNLPFRLYLSNTASLDLPSDAGECLPARQPYLFKPVARRGLPIRHGDSETTVGRRARASRTNNLTFSNLLLDKAYPSDTAILKPQSDVDESLPVRQTFLFHPAAGKAYTTTLPVDCEAFRPPNFTLLSKPVRHSESWSPVGRRWEHSRPDNLAFSSPTLATLTHPTQWVLCPRWASVRASQLDWLTASPLVDETDPLDSLGGGLSLAAVLLLVFEG